MLKRETVSTFASPLTIRLVISISPSTAVKSNNLKLLLKDPPLIVHSSINKLLVYVFVPSYVILARVKYEAVADVSCSFVI